MPAFLQSFLSADNLAFYPLPQKKSVISREEKKYIEVARKYKLNSYTMKLTVFRLFYEGYSPAKWSLYFATLISPQSI